ncbi:methylated-DNA--[protein]-cysteine S-methyltransferase [Paenibacillus elgii]|uniref:methylated-DNA--[protein]-cysteine S-methyltransferase n=1 Tax=Paenibacillus elgii TaxID=189691 RepID=UPI000FD8DB5E|nr:methylated-DNA--[protein]-cysteine S-methyltransferase [Paenibacillus elgii]NEN87332.1 methylated-DNA--[protein]-cysteine S-methyltransferase [Paenibacillus elgii]
MIDTAAVTNTRNATPPSRGSVEGTQTPYVYWTTYQDGDWTLKIAATEQGLCRIRFPNEKPGALAAWASIHWPGAALVESAEALRPYREPLAAYFRGDCTPFDMPLDVRGTPFQLEVWEALRLIPYGSTWTYAELAEVLGRPLAARPVGAAVGANPLPIVLPCHRVIGKDGSLTGYLGGLEAKTRLLRMEGFPLREERGLRQN